ncbi:SDR family NAD(P)-dependent oxidoreductase [Microvirga sp. HBU67558]|uniref:SDR family NAD(P)-dependent oxidoreductase n=1 Tax=Microvirga TaxID=186650 RepID=UPI001B3927D4|nr:MULTISPECIES: SDR family NAD(P)-dependent oxidoreductase [unclassified Microvirga]MBQ0823539.1 SDR family NAD(P)-dependent oxidoreductase [Microvirga sp. HBU67558]
MTAVILGATAGVGRALGRELARRGVDVLLIARDEQSLQAEAAHLRLMYGIRASIVVADGMRPQELDARLSEACSHLDTIDALLCPIGASRSDDDGSQPLQETQSLIDTNFTAVVVATDVVLPAMIQAKRGTIVGFSSIAATRGRSANVVYSASKRALESYFESMRHRLVDSGVRTTIYRLGYVATQQSYGKALLLPIATPEAVARTICDHLQKREGCITYPPFWLPIIRIIRVLPWPIFKKMKF